ncbi:phosphoglycolate phosphatase,Predicted hydrolase (HAD superfamily),HAD hydrolase, family IIB,haloacid dehalogenase-like hydrolase [Chlamydia serpentis]|uniref:Phosphoglycolate phosphatase,Predicted hydrolase (HAD superfamily),HAD hydrolase, family IIB,haloacid dehalogenase-like hydrolase n=1 Tax=Chlamydia serpentis TaxID=1967782 RepID=A0A2R8FB16_9CHLA|nr:HAD family hydrolase [Chlamydia serpentis]SPN73541.1 phosphoglycolate phosphatase,Predicted hydrolase (HAD superfamily),HAD hydrolase, family IIB,haloacid dehalogenase-like hydrolase [Chlamydia serpentis]
MEKLLVTDIDGTITHQSHHLDSEVYAKLYSLYESGWKLFFLTGRYYKYAARLFSSFEAPYLLGCQNGASVWSSVSSNLLYSKSLPSELLCILQDCMEGATAILSVEAGAAYGDHYYRFSPTPVAQDLHEYVDPRYFPNSKERETLFETCSLKDEYPFSSFAAGKVFGLRDEVIRIQKELEKQEELTLSMTMTLMRWPFDFRYAILFLTDKSVSKGKALDRIIEILYNGKKPFVMASGDDANDIDLIQRGDFKIVMSSAPEEMHIHADFLAPPAETKGILSAWEAGVRYYEGLMSF